MLHSASSTFPKLFVIKLNSTFVMLIVLKSTCRLCVVSHANSLSEYCSNEAPAGESLKVGYKHEPVRPGTIQQNMAQNAVNKLTNTGTLYYFISQRS